MKYFYPQNSKTGSRILIIFIFYIIGYQDHLIMFLVSHCIWPVTLNWALLNAFTYSKSILLFFWLSTKVKVKVPHNRKSNHTALTLWIQIYL